MIRMQKKVLNKNEGKVEIMKLQVNFYFFASSTVWSRFSKLDDNISFISIFQFFMIFIVIIIVTNISIVLITVTVRINIIPNSLFITKSIYN